MALACFDCDGTREDVAALGSPALARARAAALLARAEAGQSEHFRVDPAAEPALIQRVAATLATHPGGDTPHGRLRHLDVGGVPRRARLEARLAGSAAVERARTLIDFVVPSVLLDAGAGPRWSYRDAEGHAHGRSEGLAVATFELFERGFFARDGASPRCDADRLAELDLGSLGAALQVDEQNPMQGLAGRLALMRGLGRALAQGRLFAENRPGGLVDWALGEGASVLPAERLLAALLGALEPIWPSGAVVAGQRLGDVWPHPALGAGARGLVPFHKLAQWLTYSLVEPLALAGVAVVELDALTVLAEYRNGGLLLDLGVLVPRAPLPDRLGVDHAAIVEWRALTVALFERARPTILAKAGVPLGAAGTAALYEWAGWQCGRAVARERRADASPPLQVDGDGSVF